MKRMLVPDELWEMVEPLLPKHQPSPKGGHPPVDDRRALAGIIFVLKTGIPWEDLPLEFGCCGMTCWRRLRDWQHAGVWSQIHQLMLAHLRGVDKLDFSRAVVDSSAVRAVGGGQGSGPNPTDRRKKGSKHHIVVDAKGVPLAAATTGAHVHDQHGLLPLVDAIPPVKGKAGRPRRRPDAVQADRAYSGKERQEGLRKRGIEPQIAQQRTGHGSGLGKTRWVVERGISWLHNFRRLHTRYDRRLDIHAGFLQLGMALIAYSQLRGYC